MKKCIKILIFMVIIMQIYIIFKKINFKKICIKILRFMAIILQKNVRIIVNYVYNWQKINHILN